MRAPLISVAAGLAAAAAVSAGAAGCSNVETVRLQPEAIHVGPGLRPIAGIQANVASFYFLFIPIPGNVTLDRVVNRMLVVAAKTMGADKIAQLRFDVTPSGGFWALARFIGWNRARASGIAVQITAPPPDPTADEGPEPQPPPRPTPPTP